MAAITVREVTVGDKPREFALFAQAKGNTDVLSEGPVPKEKLEETVKAFGDDTKLGSLQGGSAAYSTVTAALHRAPTHPDAAGEGFCLGFASHDSSGALSPWRFSRRAVGPRDIRLQVAYCGICHSDLHQIKDEWGGSKFPMVPGHEITGVVTEVGSEVTGFAVGDLTGVGCMVGSCGSCKQCGADREQYCSKCLYTYNGVEADGAATQGGYSTFMVVPESFALKFPKTLPLDAGAPLLCAGITTYSPMRHYGLDQKGQRIGVVGLGGLGHMAVKFAKAFGQHVTVISTSESKREEACARLGADAFIVSKDKEQMAAAAGSLDGIVDTVSAQHNLEEYIALLGVDAKYVVVGVPPEPYQLRASTLIGKRLSLGGSLIGGIKETQEMLDFCGEHGVVCDIEKIPASYLNEAMERLAKSDVRYRFVIDVQGSMVA